jgi:integrase
VKFTDRYIQSLRPESKEYCIRESHGFTIRVWPSGLKTFQYIYTISGHRRRLNLGQYPITSLAEAREKYLIAASSVSKGIDPQKTQGQSPTAEEPGEMTVAKLKKKYVEHITTHLVDRSVKHQDRRLEQYLIPAFGDRHVGEIRRRDAIELIESIAAKKRGAARNVLLAGRAMFTYAVHREIVEYNPFSGVGIAVPQAAPNSRDRVLSEDELKKVVLPYLTAPGGNSIIKNALLLILFTAQRPGEVVGLQKSEIEDKWWIIPWQRIKTEVKKSLTRPPQDHRVFLTKFASSLITPSDDYVFPASRGADGPIITITLSHNIACSDPPYLGLPRWTPHDLRRTAATKMSELGASDEIVDAILNHKKKGVIGTYNRNKYDKEKQKWMNKWSNWLEALIKPKTATKRKSTPKPAQQKGALKKPVVSG